MTPNTRLRRTIKLGGGRMWWASPGFVVTSIGADGVPAGESAAVVWRPPSGTVTDALATAWPTLTVTGQPSRDRLTVQSVGGSMSGALAFGSAWLYTPRGGVIPVRVARVEGTTVHLVDRLQWDITADAGSRLQSGLWWADVSGGPPVDAVTRGPGQRDQPVPYSIQWGVITPAPGSGPLGTYAPEGVAVEGLLSVVRQPFATGLTPDGLAERFPEVARHAQPGSAGTGAAIARTHEELAQRVRGDVREARGGGYAEDDVDGGAFLLTHAAMAASALLESVAPERAEALATMADTTYRRALAVCWLDENRDGVVDLGELPGSPGLSTAAQLFPAAVVGRSPITWESGRPQ